MATNLDDIQAIRVHFLDMWDGGVPATYDEASDTWTGNPVIFDNDPAIDQPKGIWARLSVNPGASRRASIASRTYEQLGRIYLQVFVPEGMSDHDGWALAQNFAASFRDLSLDNYRVRFDTPEFRTSDDDAWYMILVTVPYTAQH